MDLARSPSQPQSGTALEISRDATPLPSEKNNLQQDSSPRLLLTSESNSKKILATTTEYDNNSSNNKQAHSDDDKTLSTVISVTSNSLLSSVHASCDNIVPTTIPDDSQNASHTNMTNVMPIERPKSRTREVSEPFPPSQSVSVVHRVTLPQPQNQAPNTAPLPSGHFSPVLINSPINSPSVDSQAEFDAAERSDSSLGTEDGSTTTSVEIISTCLDDSELSMRLNGSLSIDGSSSCGMLQRTADGNTSIDFSKLTRPPVSRSTSTSTASTCQTPTHVHASLRSVTPVPAPTKQSQAHMNVPTGAENPLASGAVGENEDLKPIQGYTGTKTDLPGAVGEEQEKTPEKESVGDGVDNTAEIVKTPNVYINGLHPHFPDESLLEMTREFGNVLSVRTFTRCVGDKMSGYGFVLFDSIEAAERCIETLSKYRNLHPSFSKQVHKIPGTPYASGTITIPPSGSNTLSSSSTFSSIASFPSFPSLNSFPRSTSGTSLSSLGSSKSLGDVSGYPQLIEPGSNISGARRNIGGIDIAHGEHDLTFREKMHLLRDERSTNLYMEGLPLSIDDMTLAGLVSPYRILSSRLFQTKLSNPPKMIAFVRLETRQAAEEIVERLHGRVVRGWNDNGGRISVRFADSNEQRELRRAERLSRGEEEDVGAAGRLSMAHAALLSLRGAEMRAKMDMQARQQQQRQNLAVLNSLQHANHVVQQQQNFLRNGAGKHQGRTGANQSVVNGFQNPSMIQTNQQAIVLEPGLPAVQLHRNGNNVSVSGLDATQNLNAQVKRQQQLVRSSEQDEYAHMLDAAMRGVRDSASANPSEIAGSGIGTDTRLNQYGSLEANGRAQGDLGVGLDPAVVARRLANSGINGTPLQSPVVNGSNSQSSSELDPGYNAMLAQRVRAHEVSLRKQQIQQIQAHVQGQGYVGRPAAERLMPSAHITTGHLPGTQFVAAPQLSHQPAIRQHQQQRSIGQVQGFPDIGVEVRAHNTGYDDYALNEQALRRAVPETAGFSHTNGSGGDMGASANANFLVQQNTKQAMQQHVQGQQQQQNRHGQITHTNSFRNAQHAAHPNVIPEEDEEHRQSMGKHVTANGNVNVSRPNGHKSSVSTGTSDSGTGDVTVVSPALTYTSQTPSTLSPATPLFNTGAFTTPASAPASVGAPKKSAIGVGVGGGIGFPHGAKKERERAFSVTVRPDGGV